LAFFLEVGKSQIVLRDEYQFSGGVIELNGGPLDPDQSLAEQMTNIESENEFIFVHGKLRVFSYDFIHSTAPPAGTLSL
jgi:hypothetical protein